MCDTLGSNSYTNASLTARTNTFPASERRGELMKPGIWEFEHEGPGISNQSRVQIVGKSIYGMREGLGRASPGTSMRPRSGLHVVYLILHFKRTKIWNI